MSPDPTSLSNLDKIGFDDFAAIPVIEPRKKAANEYDQEQDRLGAAEQSYRSNPLALHGDKAPNFAVIHEKPEHRLMVYMVAENKSTQEIANLFGLSPNWVRQIKRQPWFRERLVEVLHEAGRGAVEAILQGEVVSSIETLIEVRDDTAAKAATRVAAANALLDRALGKPIQTVKQEITKVPLGQVAEESQKLDNEIRSINEQLKQAGVN